MGDSVFTPRSPEVRYAAAGVGPPSALYIFREDQLVIDTWSSTAPGAIHIKARVLTPEGRIQTSAWTHMPNSDRSQATTYHDLGEGFLLGVMVLAPGLAYRRGHCWCLATLQRGRGAVGLLEHVLIADYVTQTGRLVWPGGQIRSSVEGPGLIRSVAGADPAAGAEVLVTVPTRARWRPHSIRFVLVTDNTAVNREADLVIDDGATTLLIIEPPALQGASATRGYNYGADFPSQVALTQEFLIPLPVGLILLAGYRIRTVTTNIQAADNYGAPQVLVEEWIEP